MKKIFSIIYNIFGGIFVLFGLYSFTLSLLTIITGVHLYGIWPFVFFIVFGCLPIFIGFGIILRSLKKAFKIFIILCLCIFIILVLFVLLYYKQLPFDYLIHWQYVYNW